MDVALKALKLFFPLKPQIVRKHKCSQSFHCSYNCARFWHLSVAVSLSNLSLVSLQ